MALLLATSTLSVVKCVKCRTVSTMLTGFETTIIIVLMHGQSVDVTEYPYCLGRVGSGLVGL